MNVVYICQQNPWRLDGGALIRNYWFVRGLSERYDVHLVTADDANSVVPPEFAQRCASISRFPRPRGHAAMARRVAGMLRPKASYYTAGSVTAPMADEVKRLVRTTNGVAIADLGVIDAVADQRLPVIYHAHNAESEHLRRRAGIESSVLLRQFVRLDAVRLRRIERETVRRARAVIVCSGADRDDLSKLADGTKQKMIVAPNGVDLERYAAVAQTCGDGKTILITGSYDWRPNIAGLQWFIDEVLPVLRSLVGPKGAVGVRVAGRMNSALAAHINARPLMTASPNPSDMRSELAAATVVAAPVLSSSGTRLRILEAWGARRAVVTTTAGAFGLECAPDSELVIADRASAFAQTLVALMYDPPERDRLAEAGLQRARYYAWPVIIDRFLAASDGLLRGSRLNGRGVCP